VGSTSHAQMYDAFGAYVRSQRHLAQLTLRQAAELASISNPYLSQIEHGLALPSISVISALAEALSVSAETMLLRAAGIVSPCTSDGWSVSEDAIRHDSRLDEAQKLALLAVLASFVGSPTGSSAGVSVRASQDKSARTKRSVSAASKVSPSKESPTGVSPTKVSPTRVSPTKVSPTRVSPTKTSGRPATAGAVSTRRKRT
jgi:transcriptional regulator with XRE-family HTH domain